MKFDGTDWVDVGGEGFSAGISFTPCLAFCPADGNPYVAYQDWGNQKKATVMQYDSVYVGIAELHKSRLSIFPSPAKSFVTVSASGAPVDAQLTVYNTQGQMLYKQPITESKTIIDVSALPIGVYFVRLTSDKTVQVGKFNKQ